jgi:glyoxylate reductase
MGTEKMEMGEKKPFKVLITQYMRPISLDMLSPFADVILNPYDRPMTEDEMIMHGADADAFCSPFAEPHRVYSAKVMDHCPKLKLLGWSGLGFDHIDIEEATKRGIYITYNDITAPTVADQTVTLMLVAARNTIPAYEAVLRGEWENKGYALFREFLGNNLHGKTVGIAGLGRIGFQVAKRVSGFGTRILYYDSVRSTDKEKEVGATAVDFDTLLLESDFIACNLPLNDNTHEIFDANAFARMKPNAIFVNTSRGGCVNTEALYDALREKKIRAAALDVISPEPFPASHPILKLPNFVLVPHIAGMTHETEEQQHIEMVQETLRVLRGYRPNKIMNPKVLDVRPLPHEPSD